MNPDVDYGKIVSCITQANGITIMEYDVDKQLFIKWNGNVEAISRTFSLEDYYSYIYADDLAIAKKLIKVMNEGRETYYACEYRYLFPNAKEYSWQYNDIYAYEIDDSGRVKSYLGVCRRNNKWHHAMDEMIMLRSKSDEANRMKTKFIQNMSHEIRTPLNAIIGFSQLLCSGDVSEELKGEFQEIISQNSQSLLRIFDDILDISRLEEGSMEFTYEPLDVNGFLKNILRSFALYQKDDLKLLLDDTSGNVNIVTDRNGLTTILNNLLSNAFKFTPSGQITVGYKPQGNGVQFCVRDTGVGIRPEATNKIFGRFEKADDFTAGTGLGLAICKELVIALHGVISVDSAVGAGSAFFVWLPSLDSAVR